MLDVFVPGKTNVLSHGTSVFVAKKKGTTLYDLRIVEMQPDGSEQTTDAREAVVTATPGLTVIEMSDVVIHRPSVAPIRIDKLTHRMTTTSNQHPAGGDVQ